MKCKECGKEKIFPVPHSFGVAILIIQQKKDYAFKEDEFSYVWDNLCINCALERMM